MFKRVALPLSLVLACIVVGTGCQPPAPVSPPVQEPPDGRGVSLTDSEWAYLKALGPVTLVVDPDWEPYEWVDEKGLHLGIAAELVERAASRVGIRFQLVRTKDWDESLEVSRAGKALAVAFLNQTPKRDEWLTFTEPYFTDPNVFITRESHDFIADPARLSDETIVFPSGTSLEERIRTLYPNLKILVVGTEAEALAAVADRRADMTLRSLTMAAYTIRKNGLFSLKIAGRLPDLDNRFRMGVLKSEPRLKEILDRGLATLTPQEVQSAINRHVSINVTEGLDWRPLAAVLALFLVVAALAALWIWQLRTMNGRLAARDAEKAFLLKEVHHRIKNNMNTVNGILVLHASELTDPAAIRALEDAQNRIQSMMVLYDRLYQSSDIRVISLAEVIPDLVNQIVANFPASKRVTVETSVEPLALASDRAQPLVILINELLTNTMKYAFLGRDRGQIRVELKNELEKGVLVVEDDGVGMPVPGTPKTTTGFGLSLVGMMAQTLGGNYRYEGGPGTRFVLEFPLGPR